MQIQIDERFGVLERNRAQHHGVDQTEDRRIGANAEGQGEDGDSGKRGPPGQGTQAVAHVAADVVESGHCSKDGSVRARVPFTASDVSRASLTRGAIQREAGLRG